MKKVYLMSVLKECRFWKDVFEIPIMKEREKKGGILTLNFKAVSSTRSKEVGLAFNRYVAKFFGIRL